MSGLVHLLGPAGKLLFAGANPDGSPLLAPMKRKIPDDFAGALGEAVAESVEKGCQHLGPRNRPSGRLAQGDSRGPKFAGEVGGLLGKIQAEPEDGQGQMARAGDSFHEETSELPIFDQEIIGPFQKGLESGQATHGVSRREGAGQGKEREQGCGRFQQDGAPEAKGVIGCPPVPLPAPPGGLNFRGPDGRNFAGFAGEVLGGTGRRQDMDPATERVIRRQERIDERRGKRVGFYRPRGAGFRGRNCRKS